ncbi:MAG TPA: hypothetical protein VFN01_00620 [Marinobacter sp.]|uniref:hypothetical protein n=1 Tax=Marinobacter sp. TaxID=50741 RepID=UPI002D7E919B|nr:hypothetical protein [Marinobacter sp.]HET8799661.1 hypothetical protein [Marinobacter sp.]
MTKPTKDLTLEEMTEHLYGRAEEIFLLCALITRRGLAHAFCELAGHVGTLRSRVLPVDTEYQEQHSHLAVAELHASLVMDDGFSDRYLIENFQQQMSEMDTFVNYLDFLIERNTPVTITSQEHAA